MVTSCPASSQSHNKLLVSFSVLGRGALTFRQQQAGQKAEQQGSLGPWGPWVSPGGLPRASALVSTLGGQADGPISQMRAAVAQGCSGVLVQELPPPHPVLLLRATSSSDPVRTGQAQVGSFQVSWQRRVWLESSPRACHPFPPGGSDLLGTL